MCDSCRDQDVADELTELVDGLLDKLKDLSEEEQRLFSLAKGHRQAWCMKRGANDIGGHGLYYLETIARKLAVQAERRSLETMIEVLEKIITRRTYLYVRRTS